MFFIAFSLCTISVWSSPILTVEVDYESGSYELLYDGEVFLESAATGCVFDGEWYSSDGSLGKSGKKMHTSPQLSSVRYGTDPSGRNYKEILLHWRIEGEPNKLFTTLFQEYTEYPLIVFQQVFPQGAKGTAIGSKDDLLSSFPSWKVDPQKDLNYVTFGDVFSAPHNGKWNSNDSPYHGGHKMGPVTLYNSKLQSVLHAPLTNFMIGFQVRGTKDIAEFASGIIGTVGEIPVEFKHSTVVVAGEGINAVHKTWGDFNMEWFQKRRVEYTDDQFLENLGYWTDNGAFYYYNPDEGKDLQHTLIDVVERFKNTSLPIRNIQYDSYWYYKDVVHGGCVKWEPQPEWFPDMAKMNEIIGLPVAAHNKYFSNTSEYVKQFEMTVDGWAAIPKHKDLYVHIMKKARDEWGLTMYEHDWLCSTYDQISQISSSINVGRDWIINLLTAAYDLGLTIQMCMPYPAHILQTLEFPETVVTNARASSDYSPCERRENRKIGQTSMYYYFGAGIMPFKDTFWTSDLEQTGCRYKKCVEEEPILQTIVATLSVGPSDKIGMENTGLIHETCNKQGRLLRPDRPATTIDAVYAHTFVQNKDEHHSEKEYNLLNVQSTFTCFGDFACFYTVYSINLAEEFEFTVDMLPFDAPIRSATGKYWAVPYVPLETKLTVMVDFDKENPLKFKAGSEGENPFELWTIVPVINGTRWSLIKELGKITGMSKQRVTHYEAGGGTLYAKVVGMPLERADFVFAEVTDIVAFAYTQCIIGVQGFAQIVCDDTWIPPQCVCQND